MTSGERRLAERLEPTQGGDPLPIHAARRLRRTTCPKTHYRNARQPDPIRLAYRDAIKQTIHAVVTHPQDEALIVIAHAVADRVPEPDRTAVQSVIVDELRRLHEGVLARYGLRPSEFDAWKVRVQG